MKKTCRSGGATTVLDEAADGDGGGGGGVEGDCGEHVVGGGSQLLLRCWW